MLGCPAPGPVALGGTIDLGVRSWGVQGSGAAQGDWDRERFSGAWSGQPPAGASSATALGCLSHHKPLMLRIINWRAELPFAPASLRCVPLELLPSSPGPEERGAARSKAGGCS